MVLSPKASLGFLKETATNKVSLGQNVITALTANAGTFPNLPVTLATLTGNNNDLSAAILAAQSGDHYAVATLRSVEKTWNTNFRLTANYVSFIADGNEPTILLAALTPTKVETTPAQLPPIPANLSATADDMKGAFNAATRNVPGAKAYVFAAHPDGAEVSYNGNVMQITVGTATVYVQVSTKSKAKFANLPTGTQLYVSAYAVNSAGCGPAANGQEIIPQ